MRAALNHFNSLHCALTESLLQCRAKPTPRAVHNLRTGIRRFETHLQKLHEDHPHSRRLQTHADKLHRHLNPIRKLAGAVRDLDIHRRLLHQISASGTLINARGTAKSIHRESHQLDHHLKQQRKSAAKKLTRKITTHELRIERALKHLTASIKAIASPTPAPIITARRWLQQTFIPPQTLSEKNLHLYRRRTKLIRYLAELQPRSAAARTLVRRLQRIHNAIGNWHDWATLAVTATSFLTKNSPTLTLIQQHRGIALNRSLKILRANSSR